MCLFRHLTFNIYIYIYIYIYIGSDYNCSKECMYFCWETVVTMVTC